MRIATLHSSASAASNAWVMYVVIAGVSQIVHNILMRSPEFTQQLRAFNYIQLLSFVHIQTVLSRLSCARWIDKNGFSFAARAISMELKNYYRHGTRDTQHVGVLRRNASCINATGPFIYDAYVVTLMPECKPTQHSTHGARVRAKESKLRAYLP